MLYFKCDFFNTRFNCCKKNSPTIDIKSPVIVGSVALAIPEAIALALPVPVIAIMSKTSIIPVTVPRSPSSGHNAINP